MRPLRGALSTMSFISDSIWAMVASAALTAACAEKYCAFVASIVASAAVNRAFAALTAALALSTDVRLSSASCLDTAPVLASSLVRLA